MNTYTKLFSSIVTSTIWQESKETKVVWVTMLALSDKNGEVAGSIPGLAYISGVTTEECEAALETLLSPDPYSRTVENEGRRIEKIDGGWLLLNHAKYRRMASIDEVREAAAERKRRSRERGTEGSETSRDRHRMSQNVTVKPYNAKADAKADADSRKELFPENPPEPAPSKPPAAPPASTASPRVSVPARFLEFWDAYGYKRSRGDAEKAFAKAIRIEDPGRIIEEAAWHAKHADADFRPYPASWLNAKGWLDLHDDVLARAGRGNGKPGEKAPPKYTSETGEKERALKQREEQLRAELPDDAATAAMLAKLAEKFPTQRT